MFEGALISAGLIMAIGAQNAFVLRQGLLKNNIFYVVLTCFVCDALLISLGVFGLGALIHANRYAAVTLAIVGALFLAWYGLRALGRALEGSSHLEARAEGGQVQSVGATICSTLALTLLNPHVYLDTVVIVGGIAGTLAMADKVHFMLGAVFASFVWFFGIGYGARFLLPLFKNNRTWQILDVIVAVIMWSISISLIKYAASIFLG